MPVGVYPSVTRLTPGRCCGRVKTMSLPHVSVRPETAVLRGHLHPDRRSLREPRGRERLDVILDHFPTIRREAAVAVLRESLRMVRERATVDAGVV